MQMSVGRSVGPSVRPSKYFEFSENSVSQLWDQIETWGFREDIKDIKGINLMMMTTMRRTKMRWRTTTRMTTLTRVSQLWNLDLHMEPPMTSSDLLIFCDGLSGPKTHSNPSRATRFPQAVQRPGNLVIYIVRGGIDQLPCKISGSQLKNCLSYGSLKIKSLRSEVEVKAKAKIKIYLFIGGLDLLPWKISSSLLKNWLSYGSF